MHAHVLIAICVLLATATDTAGSKVADDKRNSVMYFVETKLELFLFGEVPAAPAPDTSTSAPTTGTSAPATSTSAPATSTSAPATSTGASATSISAPAKSTSALATSTSAQATSTSSPATSTSASATSTRTPATNISTSSNAPLPSSTIPLGYTYYPATGSAYKVHYDDWVSWHVANTTCAGEGAHVVVLNDAREADIVARIVNDAVGSGHVTWTGLLFNLAGGEMEWRTVNGEPLSDLYHVWADGYPLNNARWACAYLEAYNKELYDEPCDETWSFTCEISQQQ